MKLRVRRVSGKKLQKMFDKRARYYLGISGEEFLRRWNEREYDGNETTPVMHVAMLVPFVR